MKKDVQYRFVQSDLSNYYHPLGFAYFADGAHDDVDELEPGIDQNNPDGSATGCGPSNTCPAPMYLRNGEYLGAYSNIVEISPLKGDEDFGLDVYEPEFFVNPVDWSGAGDYEVALKFENIWPENDNCGDSNPQGCLGGAIGHYRPGDAIGNGTCVITFPQNVAYFHIFDAHIRTDSIQTSNKWAVCAANPGFEPGEDQTFSYMVLFDNGADFAETEVEWNCSSADEYTYRSTVFHRTLSKLTAGVTFERS